MDTAVPQYTTSPTTRTGLTEFLCASVHEHRAPRLFPQSGHFLFVEEVVAKPAQGQIVPDHRRRAPVAKTPRVLCRYCSYSYLPSR
jgi:hypothetical protein